MGWAPDIAVGLNNLRLKLRAAGLPLEGLRWKIIEPYWNPEGFDFQCDDYERLLNMVENNPRFGRNTVGLPGYDSWREAKVESLGYSQKGVYNYLHLDIASSRKGLCRVYVAPQTWGRWRNASDGPPKYLSNEVYQTIARRLAPLGIKLDEHIGSPPTIGGTTLDGVTFSPANYPRLAAIVANAKRGAGQTFIEGKSSGTPDAIDLSFLATSGRGFREISWTDGPAATLDFSALHLALSPLTCNIHIDEFGVVIAGPDGQVSMSPNALHHIANELILKTIIKGFLQDKLGLPPKYIDHVFVELPNTSNNMGRYGGGVEGHWKSVKITGSYTCSVGDGDCRKMFMLQTTF
jgi:hypothetical protein